MSSNNFIFVVYINKKPFISFDEAINNGVKMLCYDCKINNEEIIINNQVLYEK